MLYEIDLENCDAVHSTDYKYAKDKGKKCGFSRRMTMPWSKTMAEPGLYGAFFTSQRHKNNPRPGQNLVLKMDWTQANFSTKQPKTGQHRAFFSLKEIRNTPRPGQNLVLKIDWTRANFSTKQHKTGAKLRTQNRLDWSTADHSAQNNPRPGQNKILGIDWTRENFST